MKYHISRGVMPQCKDYSQIHVLRMMLITGYLYQYQDLPAEELPAWDEAKKHVQTVKLFSSYHPAYDSGMPKAVFKGKDIRPTTYFYRNAFGFGAPPKITRRIMEKLERKGYVQKVGYDIPEPADFSRSFARVDSYSQHFSCEPNGLWRFQRWQITEKGYNALISAETPKEPSLVRLLKKMPLNQRIQMVEFYNANSFREVIHLTKFKESSRQGDERP